MDTDHENSLGRSPARGVDMMPYVGVITSSDSGPLNTTHESTDSGLGSSIITSECGAVHSFSTTHVKSLEQISDKMLPLKKRKLHPLHHLIPDDQQSSSVNMSNEQFGKQFSSLPVDLSSTSHRRYPPHSYGLMMPNVVRTVSSNEPLYIPGSLQSSTQMITDITPVAQNDMLRVVNSFAALKTQLSQQPDEHRINSDSREERQVSPMQISRAESPEPQGDSIRTSEKLENVAAPAGYNWIARTVGDAGSPGAEFARDTVIRGSEHVQQKSNQRHKGAKHSEKGTNVQRRCRSRKKVLEDASAEVSPNIKMDNMHVHNEATNIDITSEDRRLISEIDEDGDLPLHIAVVQEQPFAVDKMIAIMRQINIPLDFCNNLKQTPLHLATITKQSVIVKKLLQAMASPNIPDRKGHTCCHLAVNYNSPECLRTILAHSSLPVAVDANNFEGLTGLHRAVQQGHLECARLLIQYGANINLVDGKSGKTPLYLAFECNQPQAADLLMSKGADVNIPTYSGSTVLQAANNKGQHLLTTLIERNDGDITNSSVRELQSKLTAKANRNRHRTNHSLPLTTSSNKRQFPVTSVDGTALSTKNYDQQDRHETT